MLDHINKMKLSLDVVIMTKEPSNGSKKATFLWTILDTTVVLIKYRMYKTARHIIISSGVIIIASNNEITFHNEEDGTHLRN